MKNNILNKSANSWCGLESMAGILRRVDKGLILWTQSSPGTFCIDQKFSLQFKLKLTSPLRHFRWVCLQTSATGVHEVNSICVVCVILVIRCLHTSAGSYPIHRLQSNDLAQLYRGRILLSANVEGGEKSMPAYLVCCHTTGAAVRSGQAGSFMLPGVWSTDSLTSCTMRSH